MEKFFATQLDYIFFVYGLAFVIMSMIVFYAHRQTKLNLPLKWLAIFALCHGLGQWLNLAVILFNHETIFTHVREIVIACSVGLLCETGRYGLSQLKIKVPGRHIYLIFAVIIALGTFTSGLKGMQVTANYTLGIAGAAMTAAVFAISYRRDKTKNKYYLAFSGILIGCGIIIIVGVPKTTIFPATIINYESFFEYFHVPVPFVCAIMGTIFTILLTSFVYDILDYNKNFSLKMKYVILYLPVCTLIAITGAGWIIMNYTSENIDSS
ncbi:MAG: hypothetical protein ABFD79_10370, partial [Phycisphaerales bacterium]